MPSSPEIFACDGMFMDIDQVSKCSGYKAEVAHVLDSTAAEDGDLDLHG